MARMDPVTVGRGTFVARNRSNQDPRLQRHLRSSGLPRITPDMIAGMAILALASVSLFGQLGVLMFIGGSAAVIAMRPLGSIQDLVRFSPLLLLPLLAVLSTMWSDSPQQSMRGGLELLLTFAAVLVICRSSTPQTMVLSLFIANSIMVLLLLPYVPASLASKQALFAWMGSKNVVGFTGYLLFALGLGVLFDKKNYWLIRLSAVVALPAALLIIYVSQSGGTTSTLFLTLLVFPPLAMLGRLPLSARIVFGILVLVVLLGSIFFLSEIDAAVASFRQQVLNKDATLTGRTYLWEFAGRLTAVRPTWGYGYAAFWRFGNVDAEGLWRWGGVHGGFNFHNAFLEVRVDMGWVGFYILITSCIGTVLAGFVRQIIRPNVGLACLIGMTLVMYVRSYVEDGLVAPFSLQTMIWMATGIYAFAPAIAGSPQSGIRQKLRMLRGQILRRDMAIALPGQGRGPLRDVGRSGQGPY